MVKNIPDIIDVTIRAFFLQLYLLVDENKIILNFPFAEH